MDSLTEKTWELSDGSNDSVLAILSSVFNISVNSSTAAKLIFLDDFDSHIWKANYLFYKNEARQFNLLDPAGKLSEISGAKNARFWWDFSDKNNVLQQLIGKRAVTPVTSLHLVEKSFSLCNEDQKVVVRGRLTEVMFENTAASYLSLMPLRGYKKSSVSAERALDSFAKTEISHFGLKYILMNYAAQYFEKSKGYAVSVTAGMATEDAVRAMASSLLSSASLHVEGAVNDIDTEFLRKFRVGLRRLRSLISLVKKSLPQATADILKQRLSLIARKTNTLRDLDVFLLDEARYRELLPEDFNPGLSELYALVRKQRKEEQQILARYFLSETYLDEIASIANELSLPSVYETKLAGKPVLEVVKKLLLGRYHKMLAMSVGIHSLSADEEVHALRIELKKFRYLTEFFADLLPKETVAVLIGEMKKIQIVLGDFNDYATQIDFLKHYIDDKKIDMSKSLCGLIAILHQKQIEEKRKVTDALDSFFTEKMTDRVNILFGLTIQGESE